MRSARGNPAPMFGGDGSLVVAPGTEAGAETQRRTEIQPTPHEMRAACIGGGASLRY
jgi:hypothetical protein